MKIGRSILGVAITALWCTGAGIAQNQTPPAVNLAALQVYGRGGSTIVGTTHFSKEGTAYCAPDVPYVNWYLSQLNSPRRPQFAPILSRYTRTARIGRDGSFTCSGVGRGRYVVWIEGDRRVGGDFSGEPTGSTDVNPSTGQVNPNGGMTTGSSVKVNKEAFGSDSASSTARFFAGPKHILVGARTTVRVSL